MTQPPASPQPPARNGASRAAGSRWLRKPGLLLLGLALVAGAAAAVWRLVSPPQKAGSVDLGRLAAGVRRGDLNLVLVTLDTTRADRIGAYGSRDVQTPNLDRLARDGVLFEQAMGTAPITLPAHSSIFTAKFPPEHGVRDNGGFYLSADQLTLAEVLKARGFRTGAFVAAYVLDSKWGLDQGFDTYFDDFDLSKVRTISLGSIQRPGNEVVDKALPWMDQVKDGRFFAWLHFYDPHTPYSPPEPFKSRYRGRPYNGEVAFTDAQMGRVVAFLESRGLLEKTVVVVLGDHGESLGDHGEGTHGFFIYESATHVPFIVRAPFTGTRERRVSEPVRAVDLMPTALELLGVPVPQRLSGATLVPLMAGARRELGLEGYAEALYPLHHYGWSDLRALRSGRYKLIDAPRPELFDLELDPRETTNVFDARRTIGDRMVTRLRQMEQGFEQAPTRQPEADVDPEARARLAALGYVGSFVATVNEPRTDRADPKDKIGLFNKLGAARDLGKEREEGEEEPFEKVIALLNEVIAEDPDVIDAWFMLGTKHLTHGQPAKAVEYFKRTLSLKPDYDLAVINMASAYRALGQDDAALAGFARFLEMNPKDPYVRYKIGEIHLDRADLARAESAFNEALALDPKVAPARNALGVIALQRGNPAQAERLIREAIAIKEDVRLAHYNLALIAEQRGDIREAERQYVEELKRHPDSFKAAFNLSRLYEGVGDREGQIGALKQSIESNPQFAEGHFFLAKAYLESGTNFDEAVKLARKGLELGPKSEMAPLGHYVLADIYNRQGRAGDAAREAAAGRALEAQARRRGN